MPARKPLPRGPDGTVNIKEARKQMRGHRTDKEIETRIETEVHAPAPKRVSAPKYLPNILRDEFRGLAKQLIELHIFAELDYDMLARYLMAREAYLEAQAHASRAIGEQDEKASGVWTKTANIYFGQCQSCAAALGLSISSRCRLVVPKPPKDPADDDPLSQMLRKQTERRQRA